MDKRNAQPATPVQQFVRPLRVLVACEFSGTVRDAFAAKGHDAWSCDLLETEKPGPHYQSDVRDVLDNGWDMMICHPPCTHLAVSGARWFKDKLVEQGEALEFVRLLLAAPELLDALEESLALNVNWSETAEEDHLRHLSEYKRVIQQARAAIEKALGQ